jgi:hypothetical protein
MFDEHLIAVDIIYRWKTLPIELKPGLTWKLLAEQLHGLFQVIRMAA